MLVSYTQHFFSKLLLPRIFGPRNFLAPFLGPTFFSVPKLLLRNSLLKLYQKKPKPTKQDLGKARPQFVLPKLVPQQGFVFTVFCDHIYLVSKLMKFLILSKPQPNLNTTVGFDMKMTLQIPPPTTHRNFSGTSRRARELKFGTDTHQTNLIKIT